MSIPIVRLTAVRMPCCLMLALTACANGPQAESMVIGENAAYLIMNGSSLPAIQMPQMIDARSGRLLYANLQATSIHPSAPVTQIQPAILARTSANFDLDPGDEDLSMPARISRSYAGVAAPHRVPDYVLVSWRQQPKGGQRLYGGPPVTPVKVSLRANIPADVLALVRNQWRYRLDIAVLADHGRPAVGWRVVTNNTELPHEIRRGGYWSDTKPPGQFEADATNPRASPSN